MKIFLILSLLIFTTVQAHPGRTDKDGGHKCKTKCEEKWGLEFLDYHLHAPKESPKAKTKAKRSAKKETTKKN